MNPCVLVLKTPVAARGWMAGRIGHATPGLAGQVKEAAQEQERTLGTIEKTLARHGVEPQHLSVDALDAEAGQAIASARLVITVGGDGTLLSVSQWVTAGAILGVNSSPRSSVGHLALARRESFSEIFGQIARGELHPIPVTRLACRPRRPSLYAPRSTTSS